MKREQVKSPRQTESKVRGSKAAGLIGLLLGLVMFWSTPATWAQVEEGDEAVETTLQLVEVRKEKEWTDSLGRESPRGSARGLIQAIEDNDYELAAHYMDFRNLPRNVRDIDHTELIKQFDFVIQRALWVDAEALSPSPDGLDLDGLPSYRDLAGKIDMDGKEISIYMQKVPAEEAGQNIWKLSNATVAEIPRLYDLHSYPDWLEKFRGYFPEDATFIGLELFKWAFLVCVILVGWPLLWLLALVLTFIFTNRSSSLYKEIRRLFTGPLTALVLIGAIGIFLRELGMGLTAQKIADGHTLMTIVIVWLVFSSIDLLRAKRRERFIAEGRSDAAVLGRPLANAVKLLTIIVAILMWLSNIGVEITALVAGLGVGGVALALAMQKPIEDLLGAISIYSQRPFNTGDLCRYGSFFGTVEEVGLRTTRMRTRANTLVSIPNSRLAYEDIENISAREKIEFAPTIRLRIDTTTEQIVQIKTAIQSLLQQHELVLEGVQRVQFRDFAEYSLQLNVHTYIGTTKFDQFLEVSEQLNLGILAAIHDAGAFLAMPEGGWEQDQIKA
jgi:MscS family membrane protein